MITILEHGKKNRAYKASCFCGCIFLYETADIVDILGDSPWVRCPECDLPYIHSESDIVKEKEERK